MDNNELLISFIVVILIAFLIGSFLTKEYIDKKFDRLEMAIKKEVIDDAVLLKEHIWDSTVLVIKNIYAQNQYLINEFEELKKIKGGK
jgi:hypothetical protein